jgi:DNA primase
MIPGAMDSLDFVEAVMVLEEVLGIEIPTDDAEQRGSPREMVDWLEQHLSNQRPTKQAAELLKGLAKSQNNPELAEGLQGVWRREQIAAIVRELFQD